MARVAFILGEMFEDSEFSFPYQRVKDAGHEAVVVGVEKGQELKGKQGKETVTTDVSIDRVGDEEFDGLVIPGGYSPDKIRTSSGMIGLTRSMYEAGKPVAAICHAGWMLAEANILSGKTVTSWPSIRTDLINAGAEWVDQEVCEDGNLITSRKPDDLEAFTKAFLAQLEQTT
jgi:protease I